LWFGGSCQRPCVYERDDGDDETMTSARNGGNGRRMYVGGTAAEETLGQGDVLCFGTQRLEGLVRIAHRSAQARCSMSCVHATHLLHPAHGACSGDRRRPIVVADWLSCRSGLLLRSHAVEHALDSARAEPLETEVAGPGLAQTRPVQPYHVYVAPLHPLESVDQRQ
jgi:hypothetical protein